MDVLGHFLRLTPRFKGKGRLTRCWVNGNRKGDIRSRVLPGGSRIQCDMAVPYESMVWLEREEEDDLEALCRILKPGETFVDCGANIGVWTLTAAVAAGPEGKVHAFEPNPATFEKLMQNVKANSLEGVVSAFNLACGDREEKSPLLCSAEHNNSRMVAHLEEDAVMVPVRTLDSVLRDPTIHGIKIDVEGHELQVLQGAAEILRRSKPWLCVEFNTQFACVNRPGDWEVHQYLGEFGYACCRMADATGTRPGEILRDDLEMEGYCNLFYFIP